MNLSDNFNLVSLFYEIQKKSPDNVALKSSGVEYSYQKLANSSAKIARMLKNIGVGNNSRVGILTDHNSIGLVSILGTCWAGATFVPMNAKQPASRIQAIVNEADFSAFIVDSSGYEILQKGVDLSSLPQENLLVFKEDSNDFSKLFSLDEVLPMDCPEHVREDDLAYIIFTSGTTGTPKGVMVTAKNLRYFVDIMQESHQLKASDRVSQFFEFTFDVSMFDIFVTISSGAAMYMVPETNRLSPTQFIAEEKLTVWSSVPSTAVLMSTLRQLKENVFPSLRLTIFIGEPLLLKTANAWKFSAPNSTLVNYYGPTEVTVFCTSYLCKNDNIKVTPGREIISIGKALSGLYAATIDENRNFLEPGESGELVMAGPMVTAGYWKNRKVTDEKFIILEHPKYGKQCWYRTGDKVCEDNQGDFQYYGRVDNQVKVLGYRVELEDIDAKIRQVSGCESGVCVAWPIRNESAQGIVGFVAEVDKTPAEMKKELKTKLPAYMVPNRIVVLEKIPLTLNGKIDRNSLKQMLAKK